MPLRHACLVVAIVAGTFNIYAQSVDNPYSYNAIAGFANHLVEQKEYYRAYQEYRRLYVYYPALYSYDNFFVASLYCKYQGGQYEALLNEIHETSKLKPWIWVYSFDSAFSLLDPSLHTIVMQCDVIDSNEFEPMIIKRKLAYSLFVGDSYKQLSLQSTLINDYDIARIYEYCAFKNAQRKNPYVALAWGIIPGAGYMYSDTIENGVIAAIVISICAVVTYFAYDTGNSAIALLTGAAGTFFYGGSILGGYLAAKRTNNQIMKEVHAYLEEELKFAQDRDFIFNRYGKPKTQ